MAAAWYLKIAGKEVGPLSSQQLKTMAKKGQLGPKDLIRQGDGSSWIAAGRVKGLLSPGEAENSDSTMVALPTARPLGTPPQGGEVPVAEPVPTIPVGMPLPGPVAGPMAPMGQAPGVPMGAPMASGVVPPGASLPGAMGIVPQTPIAAVGRGVPGKAEGRKKRNTNTMALVVVVLLLVALGAGALMLSRAKTASGPSRSSGSAKETAAGEAEAPVRLEGLEELDELKGSKVAGRETAAMVTDAAPAAAGGGGDSGWASALNASVSRGPVKVKVSAVEVGSVRFTRGTEKCLMVRLELANQHETKIRSYSSWSRAPGVSLVDNFENQYVLKSARLKTESIYPGNKIEEMLVFPKPVAKAKFLRLQLPAAAFDEDGLVRFEIPTSMINEVDESSTASRGRRMLRTPSGEAVDGSMAMEAEELPPGEAPAQRPEPTISRSIEELDKEAPRQGGAGPAKSQGSGGSSKAPQAKKKPADPDGDIAELNEDIDAMGGGDKKKDVADFESDPKMMAEFEKLRQQERAEQEAKRKANKNSRGG